jgi:hypothetical protein
MAEQAELEFGETPWDKMSREELLREVQRMYAATTGLYSVVRMSKATDQIRAGMGPESDDPPNPYWGKSGVGGNELEKARQVIDPLDDRYGSGNIYRAFFRYANDLLFEDNGYEMIHDNWMVCPECGAMYGSRYKMIERPCASEPFGKPGCPGVLRKLQWSDMEKKGEG